MPVFKVIKYIIKNNPIKRVIFFLAAGFFYQIFKRLTKKIISKKIFNKKHILLFPDCHISSMLVYTDIPDKKEIETLRNLITTNTVFLDIGANIGSYSVMLMDKIDKIIAFEPHPFTAKQCKMNFLLNGHDCKDVFEIALSDKNGETFFSNNLKTSSINKIESQAQGNIVVKSQTLDSVAEKYFSRDSEYLLKIDVEGFEKDVFKGGKNFFTNYKITGIVFECFSDNKKEVFQLLESYGYKTEMISDNNFIAKMT